jgi:hypothetical protein
MYARGWVELMRNMTLGSLYIIHAAYGGLTCDVTNCRQRVLGDTTTKPVDVGEQGKQNGKKNNRQKHFCVAAHDNYRRRGEEATSDTSTLRSTVTPCIYIYIDGARITRDHYDHAIYHQQSYSKYYDSEQEKTPQNYCRKTPYKYIYRYRFTCNLHHR